MATYTPNLNLKKPATTDKIRIADFNNNSDLIDAAHASQDVSLGKLGGGMAIISTGNVHEAISAGQFVYVRKHNNLAEGLYTADSNISANATLSASNLTAISSGGLNEVNSNINAVNAKFERSGFDYIPTTTAELKEALVDMINKAPRYGFAFFILRTSDMNNTDIFPKNNYGCIVERASSSLYGSILIFTYGQPSKIYKFSYSNGDVGYSFVHEFNGTQIANW